MSGRRYSPLRRVAAIVRGTPILAGFSLGLGLGLPAAIVAGIVVLVAPPVGARSATTPAASSEVVTRSIEQRPPARPLSEAGRVDERSLSADQLEELARASRERWERSSHGAMLLRILPDRLRPSQLPQADSRGARLLALYCVQCHNLPDPAMHDANRWPEVVRRMVPRMQGRGNLGPLMADLMRAPGAGERAMSAPSADEEREIVAYLRRHAQRSLDPKADPELAQALGSGAGRMFAEACSQCHALPDPSQHTPEEWPKVVDRMRDNLDWMNRVQSRADPREPQLSVPEIVGFLQEHARRPAR
ncbi:MAG: hypothetical protein H3C59_02735 [Burkholderiaceae bacterium]|nr:hypothetical protein [Burkholderiaceae bacterium]